MCSIVGFSEGSARPTSAKYVEENDDNGGKTDDESRKSRKSGTQGNVRFKDILQQKIKIYRENRKTHKNRTLTTIIRSNKIVQAFNLPTVMNVNPRSAMNKLDELQNFIEEETVDVIFVSETHERETMKLEEHFTLEDFKVISNVHQRNEKGGRPALIVNKKKYNVEDLTNTTVQIPWGVEITWATITPKNVSNDSIIQKIVLGCIYSKPKSRKKSATLDHIAETYNFLSTKYGKGCYWIIAGDTNDLNLNPILHLSPSLESVVTKPTRLNPDRILDNIVTDLAKWYQSPKCIAPLDADVGSGGKPSDHLIVMFVPISPINNKNCRTTREVTVRPMKQSGIDQFGLWLKKQAWKELFEAETVDEKAELLQKCLLDKLDEYLPQKTRKISSDDQPFCSEKMKHLKKLKSQEFSKNRKSLKWKDLNKKYKKEVSIAKRKYYKDIIKDLKTSNISQWYSKLKRLCSYDQHKADPIIVEDIKHLSSEEQVEAIADKFAKVSQEYEALEEDDIEVPEFKAESIPQFLPQEVQKYLENIKVNKSVPPGDLPPKLIRSFAQELSVPLCHIINTSLSQGKWSTLYKSESVTLSLL